MGDKGTGKHTVMKRFCGVPLDAPNEDEMVCASSRTEINHEKRNTKSQTRGSTDYIWRAGLSEPIKVLIYGTKWNRQCRVPSGFFSDVFVVVLALDDEGSYAKLSEWVSRAQSLSENRVRFCLTRTIFVVLGNKMDKADKRVADYDTVKDYLAPHHMEYFEISATTGENLQKALEYIRVKLYEKSRHIENSTDNSDKADVDELLKLSEEQMQKMLEEKQKKKEKKCLLQ